MADIPEMTRHRGFPTGFTGMKWQFTIRRANPKVTKLAAWPRNNDRDKNETLGDAAFLHALWHYFGAEPFERGNLDAGRLSRLFDREVVPAEKPFNPSSYQAMLQINERVGRKNFPQAFEDVIEI
ncbi:hypothetical protein LJR030_004513 [Rhizobium sp. LjRoot30]|uniref:hypothetical protein n=1 Tax=Rhizobium sp. LjRoot30 TaxID=3342320 RepID=UPI003ED01689